MSCGSTYGSRYLLKSGNLMSLKAEGSSAKQNNLLGFYRGTAVVEAVVGKNMEPPSVAETPESKLCGKRIILDAKSLMGKVVIINRKKPEIPSLLRLALEDKTYQSLSNKSSPDKKTVSSDRSQNCSDFQEFESNFHKKIQSPCDSPKRRSSSATQSGPIKVCKRRNTIAESNGGEFPRQEEMGKIKHFKDKSNLEAAKIRVETTKTKRATLSKKRSFIRREIERCLLQRRTKKREAPVRNQTIACQTESSFDTATKETQTDLSDTDTFNLDLFNGHEFFNTDNGADVNFGVGPTMPTYDVKLVDVSSAIVAGNSPATSYCDMDRDANEKQLFYQCLKTCADVRSMGNLDIHLAVSQNKIADVKRQCLALKIRGMSIDTVNDNDSTPLHLAIVNDCDSEIICFLLRCGADITITERDGNNPLHLAVIYGAEDVLRMLLTIANQKNFNVDLFNYDGFTPLMLATLEDNIHMTHLLLDSKADPNLRDQKSGRTPLFHAVENNNTEMVKLLLKYKANTKIRNFFGTSTHEAIFELDNIHQEIKSIVIGKDAYQNKGKVTEKKRRPPQQRKEKPKPVTSDKKLPKLKIIKTLRRVDF